MKIFLSIVNGIIGFGVGAFIGGFVGIIIFNDIGLIVMIALGGIIGAGVGISKAMNHEPTVGKLRGKDLCHNCQNIRFGPENRSIMSESVDSGNVGNNMAAKIMYQALLPHLEKGAVNCSRNCVNKLRRAIQSL